MCLTILHLSSADMQRDCERKADELGSDSTAAVKTFTNFHFPYLIFRFQFLLSFEEQRLTPRNTHDMIGGMVRRG